MVSNLLHHLDTHRSMGPDGTHPRVWREMVEVLTKPLSIIYQQSQNHRITEALRLEKTSKITRSKHHPNGRLVNVMPIYKKGQKRIQETTGLSV